MISPYSVSYNLNRHWGATTKYYISGNTLKAWAACGLMGFRVPEEFIVAKRHACFRNLPVNPRAQALFREVGKAPGTRLGWVPRLSPVPKILLAAGISRRVLTWLALHFSSLPWHVMPRVLRRRWVLILNKPNRRQMARSDSFSKNARSFT